MGPTLALVIQQESHVGISDERTATDGVVLVCVSSRDCAAAMLAHSANIARLRSTIVLQ